MASIVLVQIQEDRREREECEVSFALSKEKDVKLKLTKPFFIRKGLEYELELQLSHVVSDDVIIPSLRNRKKEDLVEGVIIAFGAYQRPHMNNVIEILEISDIFFYF